MPRQLSLAKKLRSVILVTFLVALALRSGNAQGLRGFGPREGRSALTGFGNPLQGEMALRRQFPKLAAAVTAADRENAGREIKRTDLNGDGIVTEAEWAESGFQTPDRFRWNDLNGDGILTLFEHSLRWAQYRKVVQQRAAQQQDGAQRSTNSQAGQGALAPASDPFQQLQRKQTNELAAFVLSHYDRDRSGAVDHNELKSPSSPFGNLSAADADGDGMITQPELAAWLSTRLATQPASKWPKDIPAWFLSSDIDGDGQIQLAEFLRSAPSAALPQFRRYDRNNDGYVTVKELASPQNEETHRYASRRLYILESERETIAESLVNDDIMIQDIDVQVAIVKNGDDDIELWLTGPDGTRATLYFDPQKKPWGGGRLFDNTIFDDEAPAITQRLARPPLDRVFQPQGSSTQGLQGLKAFYNKPARGTWRLGIRNKSQVSGMLEGWALLIKPKKPSPGAAGTKSN